MVDPRTFRLPVARGSTRAGAYHRWLTLAPPEDEKCAKMNLLEFQVACSQHVGAVSQRANGRRRVLR